MKKQNRIFRFSRYLILLLFTLINFGIFAQESLFLKDSILPDTRGYENNPLALSNKLTEGTTTQKEKFDVIFTWVVKNIRYDTKAYLSTKGNKKSNIKRVLKRKKGICVDYAFLMDTLCQLAGVKNISVYGYAKDDLFDVNDSLYIDNHAWNAVRLDDRWYLYDVTWSSGKNKPEYTTFSKFILRCLKKLSSKTIVKTIKFKSSSISDCEKVKNVYTRSYQTITFFNRIMYHLLLLKKLRYRMVFDKVADLNYYLTQPEVFALTHSPDNPYWSLIFDDKKINDFERDSTYYHLNNSFYKDQKRKGQTCFECDKYFSMDILDKAKQMKKNSHDYNEKNNFIAANCDFDIAEYYYGEAVNSEDSLLKVSSIDSSLLYLSYARKDLRECLTDVKTVTNFHKSKNKKKESILKEENKKHESLIKSLVKSTFVKIRKMKTIENKNKILEKRYKLKIKKLKKTEINTNATKGKPKSKEKIAEIQNSLKISNAKSDSIDLILNELTSSYIETITLLSDNLWNEININYSLSNSFYKGARLRRVYLLDNYKKIIKEERKKIVENEDKYISNVKDRILNISDSYWNLNSKIVELTKKRNDTYFKSVKIINTLIKENVLKSDSLKNFIVEKSINIQKNRCWIVNNSAKHKAVNLGFRNLASSEDRILKSIRSENRREHYRFDQINLEILRRNTKYTNIAKNNIKINDSKKNLILKTKREYLKSLKMARKSNK